MPLIQCPDCRKSISDSAPTCIGCGRPMIQPDHKPEDILPPELLSGKSNTTNKLDVNDLLSVDSAKTSTEKTSTSACSCSGCLVFAIGMFLIFSLFGSGSNRPSVNSINRPVNTQLNKPGVITGYDSVTKKIIDPIIVYKDYRNRDLGHVDKVRHGDMVTILEEMGSGTPHGVKIKTNSGAVGWVSNWFVKED